jgi:hypothetical protein
VSTPSDPVDSVETGAIEPGAWVARVIDARTGNPAPACTVDGLHASCVLLPREAGAQSPELIIELATSAHRELGPSAFGTLGEFSLLGLTYTGKPIDQTENKFRCDNPVNVANQDGGTDHFCREFTTFFKLTALDSLRVTFNAPTMSVKTSTPPKGTLPQGELAPPNDRPNGLVTGTGFTWDAGNDDLPGTAH